MSGDFTDTKKFHFKITRIEIWHEKSKNNEALADTHAILKGLQQLSNEFT